MTIPDAPIVTDELADRLKQIRDDEVGDVNPCLIGIRGFAFNGNFRGIYDDAMFVMTTDSITSYLANVDPSLYKDGVASLTCGVWQFKEGLHGYHTGKPYPALIQASDFIITRDGSAEYQGMFAINIHKGGITTTGSEGCQTIHPLQWDDFIKQVYDLMAQFQMDRINYILVDNEPSKTVDGN